MKRFLLVLTAAIMSACLLSSCKAKPQSVDEPYTDYYNDNGTIEKKVYFNDDKSVQSEIKYEYDDHGNILSETKYLADGTFDFKATYEYKFMGNEYKETGRVVYKTEKEISFYQSDYEYESFDYGNGEQYRLKSYVRYDAEDEVIDKTVYSYDSSGGMSKVVTLDSKGNVLTENEF